MSLGRQSEEKFERTHQVGRLREQVLALAQGLANQADLTEFQVAKTAMNDPGRAAGGPGGKIVLLDQQNAAATLRTLAGDGHAIDAAANDQDIEILVAGLERATHAQSFLDAAIGPSQRY